MTRNRKMSGMVPVFELLERRVLLTSSPTIASVVADNRGLVSINFNTALNSATVTASSVKIFTAGADGVLNTADDVDTGATVSYDSTNERIQVNAFLTANTPYWVEVLNTVTDSNGNAIQGGFTGNFPTSGAGNFRFEATPSTADNIALFTIDGDDFQVQLFDSQTGFTGSIPNFLQYVNAGSYDETFIHRATTVGNSGFGIIQGGGFDVQNNAITAVTAQASIDQEPIFANVAGTLAMANTGQPTSTSNQWFFNISDNQAAFGPNYSVIGQIIGSQSVIQTADAFSTISIDGSQLVSNFASGTFTNLPVTDPTVTAQTLSPSDLVVVNRVSILEAVMTLPPSGVAPTNFVNGANPNVAASPIQPGVSFSNNAITPDSTNSLLDSDTANNLLN